MLKDPVIMNWPDFTSTEQSPSPPALCPGELLMDMRPHLGGGGKKCSGISGPGLYKFRNILPADEITHFKGVDFMVCESCYKVEK